MSNSRIEFFSRLFSESHEGLRRYIRRLVGSRDTADEIVQEAFLRAYERADSSKAPKAFLYTIARNLAMDHHRHNSTARTTTLEDCDDSRVIMSSEPLEAGLIDDERSRLLREAVEHLPPQCRAVFVLKVFHACSYKEIAERLGISPKTVENHVARGLRETNRYVRRKYKEASADYD